MALPISIDELINNIGYQNNGLFVMAPMALILVGVIIWIQRSADKDLQEKEK